MANEGYHEPIDEISDDTRDMHRAIVSLMEELEAVDWYNQRVDACKDKDLKAILAHNRDEEKEHAAMVLEWIRRKDPSFDKELKDAVAAAAHRSPPGSSPRRSVLCGRPLCTLPAWWRFSCSPIGAHRNRPTDSGI